jgi:hypothetical protein
MGFINTDWKNELEQLEATLSKFLDEKVEPMVDRKLDRSVKEVSVVMDKASFEIQDAIKQLSAEVEKQKNDFLKKLTCLVFVFSCFILVAIGIASLIF